MAEEQGDLIQQGYADFYDAITTAAAAPGIQAPDPDVLDRAIEPFRRAGRRMNVAHVRTAQAEILIAREQYADAQRVALDGLAIQQLGSGSFRNEVDVVNSSGISSVRPR